MYGFRIPKVLLPGLANQNTLGIFDESILSFRVGFSDVDFNFHVNNGRYLTIMDLGRLDLALRNGMWKTIRKHKLRPSAGSVAARFRQELRLFEGFDLVSRILGIDQKWIYIEHVLRKQNGIVAARAIVKATLTQKKTGSFSPMRILEESNITIPPDYTMPGYLKSWIEAEAKIREIDKRTK